MESAKTTVDRPAKPPVSERRQIEVVKNAVRIEDVAADYGEFRLQSAGRLLGRCVSPGHEDKTPSLTIFTDEQRFKCFGIGCSAHGDVLDLVMLAEQIPLWVALVDLAQRYGVELPERPPSWYARQERQAPIRDGLEAAMIRHVKRRLFSVYFARDLELIEDEQERKAEKARVWDELDIIARQVVARRRSA